MKETIKKSQTNRVYLSLILTHLTTFYIILEYFDTFYSTMLLAASFTINYLIAPVIFSIYARLFKIIIKRANIKDIYHEYLLRPIPSFGIIALCTTMVTYFSAMTTDQNVYIAGRHFYFFDLLRDVNYYVVALGMFVVLFLYYMIACTKSLYKSTKRFSLSFVLALTTNVIFFGVVYIGVRALIILLYLFLVFVSMIKGDFTVG